MAPKRSVPPPPPPPADSSEETASGSGSDESEEEEEMAHSPPPAAPKAPPPQKGQESETDEEDEEDDEEEEEEVEKSNHATPPDVPKNPPPPPPNREESESEEEEEEETEEAPQPKPAPKQDAEGKIAKPPSPSEDKKQGARFQRTWSMEDEVRILEAMAAHRREHGTLPQPDALVAALAGSLDHSGCSRGELQGKLKNLKRRYGVAVKKGELPSKDHDRRLFDLSKDVWGGDEPANGAARREYGELCERYPYLAEEVKALEAKHPGLFKREFAMISDDKARALNVKIKKQRLVQMKLELRRHDLTKEVTKELMGLLD